MLIDWPNQRKELETLLSEAIQAGSLQNAPAAALAAHFSAQEGSSIVVVEADGQRRPIELQEHQVTIETPRQEMLSDPAGHITRVIRGVSEAMGRKMDLSMIEKLRTSSAASGGFFKGDASGGLEQGVLSTIRAMDMAFDEQGKPQIALLAHPEVAAELARLDKEGDPELQAELNKILQEKRLEWLRRESGRRLAD